MMNNSLEKWQHEFETMGDPTFFPEFYWKSNDSTSDTVKRKLDQTELGENLYQEFSSGLHPADSAFKTEYSITFSGARTMKAQKPRNCSPELGAINWIDFDALIPGYQGDKWKDKLTTLPLPHHIVTERKRRKDLNKRFSALARVVPGITKKDKVSILGETVKYMEELQERIKSLEEMNKKKVMESVVFVKRSNDNDELPNNYCCSTHTESDDNFSSKHKNRYKWPEIEAKVLERSVLIRVHCEKSKGILQRLLDEIVKLQLIVASTNVLPFGNDAVDITVIAQMGADFCMKTKDIVEHLRLALPIFI